MRNSFPERNELFHIFRWNSQSVLEGRALLDRIEEHAYLAAPEHGLGPDGDNHLGIGGHERQVIRLGGSGLTSDRDWFLRLCLRGGQSQRPAHAGHQQTEDRQYADRDQSR